jgi:uncharacterized protein with beta-barrel porin domain
MPQTRRLFTLFTISLFLKTPAHALTLSAGDTNYTTSANITESTTSGIYSNFEGTSLAPRTITNAHIITATGSSDNGYGIRVGKSYNQVTNQLGATIVTSGSSGRGVSVFDFSTVTNAGSISTSGTTAYGIHARTSSSVSNSGSITTTNSDDAFGIYLSGNNSSANNSGTISTNDYGIYSKGNDSTINNSGAITTTANSSAHGIFVSAASASTASSTSFSTVVNSGTISASGNGIYTKDAYTEITNSGTISASSYGIRTEGANSTITNSGSVNSIYNSGTGSVINNSGNILGDLVLGAGTINISGGSISGTVDGSLNTGSVNINAAFNQTAAFLDLNNLNINSASTLTSSASISANAISIGAGSSLTLASGSSLSASIQGASNSVGTLNVATNFSATSEIGISGNSLAALNINSGAVLTVVNDIYATNILLNGVLNFNGAENLTIFGSASGSGSGTINLGTNSQAIEGNFTLNSGDTLGTTLGSGTAGNLVVSGVATIDANAKLAITPTTSQGYIVGGTQFRLVSAGSGSSVSSISDSNISVNGNSSNIYGLLKFTTATAGDTLVLTVDRLSAESATSNKNTQSIYTNLNEIGAASSGKLSDFQGYLDSSGFTGDKLTAALKQVAPQSSKANLAVTSDIARNSILTSETRLAKARQHLKTGTWVQSFGNSATQNEVKDDDGYKANSLGIIVGADKETDSNATTGVALSFARSDVKTPDNLKKNLITSVQLGFYLGQNFDKYFVDSFAGFAWNAFSSNRAITALDTNATARFSGQTYVAKIKTGRIFKLKNHFSFTPEASINILHNSVASYSENGADELNLKVGAVAANFLEARIGANLGHETKFLEVPEFKKVTSVLKFSYGRAFVNDAPTTSASFDGQALSFKSEISQIDSDSLRLGLEFAAHHEDFVSFSADYSLEKKASLQSHFLGVKIRQEF